MSKGSGITDDDKPDRKRDVRGGDRRKGRLGETLPESPQLPVRRSTFATGCCEPAIARSLFFSYIRTHNSVVIEMPFVLNVSLSEYSGRPLRQLLELTMFVTAGPTLLCAYVVAVWALSANLNFATTFPWSTGPLSNWMIWFALASLLHALTSKMQAYLNRSGKDHTHKNMSEEIIPPRFKLARELTQQNDKQLEPAWATASPVIGTGARS